MKWVLIIFLCFILVPCNLLASRSFHHRHSDVHSFFKANSQSVPLENAYANRMMLTQYLDQLSIERDVEAKVLIPVTISCSPRLPMERRYALRPTVEFIAQLDAEFASQTGHHLTVDSAVRSVKDQRSIRRWNRSAAPASGPNASSHERGTTVDLSRRMSKGEYQWLLIRLLYYRALGRILVIEERNCLHIFVIGDYDGATEDGNYQGTQQRADIQSDRERDRF